MAAAPVIAAAIAAGTAVYSSEEQSRQARLQRDSQKNILDTNKKELVEREQKEGILSKRDEEKAKRDARRAASGGRQSTILTSPLGVVENAPQANKQILGA